jgi:hypothetical protein
MFGDRQSPPAFSFQHLGDVEEQAVINDMTSLSRESHKRTVIIVYPISQSLAKAELYRTFKSHGKIRKVDTKGPYGFVVRCLITQNA